MGAHPHRRPAPTPLGLTLVEVMVTIAILGLLMALAAPSFTAYLGRERLKGIVGDAVADLQFARSEAVQRNAAVTVIFNAAGYAIERGGTALKNVMLPEGHSIAEGQTVVAVFEPARATATLSDAGVAQSSSSVLFADAGSGDTLRIVLSSMGRSDVCAPGGVVRGYPACAS